jgi:hypothetical protein
MKINRFIMLMKVVLKGSIDTDKKDFIIKNLTVLNVFVWDQIVVFLYILLII